MQTPLSYDGFVSWYPEFLFPEPSKVAAVQRQLELASMTLSSSAWGTWWQHACALYSAHYLALRFDISRALGDLGLKSATKSVGTTINKSANVSGISEGVAVSQLVTSNNPLEADFARTSYGLEYLSLMQRVIPPGRVICSPELTRGRPRL